MECVEPPPSLINRLGNEICRESVLEDLRVVEWIVPLRKGHGAGVEPHIGQLGNAAHLAAATALQCDGINVRPVKIERFRKYRSLPPQLINADNGPFRIAV